MVDVSLSGNILCKMSERNVWPWFYLYFSRIKSATHCHLPLGLPRNGNSKLLLPQPAETSSSPYDDDPKRKATEFDTCNFLIEAISVEFDPNGVLLQSAFTSTKRIPDTFPSDSIRPETTNPWLNSEVQKLNWSYSRSSMWQQWLIVYRGYVIPCVATNNTFARTAPSDWIRLEVTGLLDCTWTNVF